MEVEHASLNGVVDENTHRMNVSVHARRIAI